jgi:omega-6 fatty acid desaturase (delta-12 desaturase)
MIVDVQPAENEIRRALRPMRAKKTGLALALFAADAVVYAATFYMAARTDGPAAWLWGAAAGIATAMLFVVGHDACHGSLTARPALNRWIGSIAFLPSLTPFSAWELGHNQTHHVYTNLKPLDYVWTPFSKAEFDALPRWRRLLERIYRSAPGLGLYYGVEIWWKHLFFAREGANGRMRRRDLWNSLLCAAYAVTMSVVALRVGWTAFASAVVWPFLVWTWLMGWAIFEHHTHPDAPWFDDPDAWRAARAQTACTVHVVLPGWADAILHRIMNHTAHHLDVTVPLYGLVDAQKAVEADPSAGVIVYRWTPFTFLRHLRLCKLYDFERRCWTGFDGIIRECPPLRTEAGNRRSART